jgi:dethiobiotin synthetase
MSASAGKSVRHRGFFVAGTDTGVGKTRVAVALVHALARCGAKVVAMKPVAAGAKPSAEGLRNDDALELMHAANTRAAYGEVNPYCLAAPISPHLAAADAGVRIEPGVIVRQFNALATRADCVIVEGAGGWLAPIGPAETMADVARALDLPVILVVGLRLGCLNHALLTVRAIEANGLPLAGWVANAIDPHFERAADNLTTLERLFAAKPLAVVAHGPVGNDAIPSATAAALLRSLQRG